MQFKNDCYSDLFSGLETYDKTAALIHTTTRGVAYGPCTLHKILYGSLLKFTGIHPDMFVGSRGAYILSPYPHPRLTPWIIFNKDIVHLSQLPADILC